jgi:hypothetical protein
VAEESERKRLYLLLFSRGLLAERTSRARISKQLGISMAKLEIINSRALSR